MKQLSKSLLFLHDIVFRGLNFFSRKTPIFIKTLVKQWMSSPNVFPGSQAPFYLFKTKKSTTAPLKNQKWHQSKYSHYFYFYT